MTASSAALRRLCAVVAFVAALHSVAVLTPVASAADLSYSVAENAATGTPIGELRDAAPELLPRFNKTALSLVRFGLLKDSDVLAVDERTGRLSIRRPIDREALCPYEKRNDPCVVSADVTLRLSSQVVRVVKVQVIVTDTNDNDPAFDKTDVVVFVSESAAVGSGIATLPVARDLDSDNFGVAGYTLRSGLGVFALQEKADAVGQTELTLVLRQPLDREAQDGYRLSVEAHDRGSPPRSSSMSVNVVVLDDNDNSPTFDRHIYSAAVPESMQPGVIVATVRATDADAGGNAQVRYALSPRASERVGRTFEVGEYTGHVKLKGPLDRERVDSYMVPVVARDGGQPPRTATALVNVTVGDMNDNAPKLKITALSDYGASEIGVYENMPVETPVALLNVVDEDEGDNGLVTCYLSTPQFALRKYHADEYEMFVSAELDREAGARLAVVVQCTDSGSPPQATRTVLTVNVLDVNDNAPAFDRYMYYAPPIQENNAVGLTVIRVSAADADAGRNAEVTYSLGSERDAASFAVDATTGVVTAAVALDRETQREFIFGVRATDKGAPPLSGVTTVVVRVEDVNDNAPAFTQDSYFFTVDENRPKFTAIGQVPASDADYGTNGDLWYRLEDAAQTPFAIAHDSGVISTRAPLDRELVGAYQITVVAADYGNPARSSSAKVTVSVGDENDSDPFILFPTAGNDTFNVTSAWTINATVVTVAAVDMDAGDNGRLGYFIHSGNDDGLFSICRTSGELKLAKEPRATAEHAHSLVVGVFDYGAKPRTVFATLRINTHAFGQRADSGRQGSNSPLKGGGGGGGAQDADEAAYVSVDLAVVVILCSLSGVLSVVLVVAIIRVKRMPRHERQVGCAQAMSNLLGLKSDARRQRQQYRLEAQQWRRTPQQQPSCASVAGQANFGGPDCCFIEHQYDDRCSEEQKFLTTFMPDGTTSAQLERFDREAAKVDRCRPSASAECALSAAPEWKSLAAKNNNELPRSQPPASKFDALPGVHSTAASDLAARRAESGRRINCFDAPDGPNSDRALRPLTAGGGDSRVQAASSSFTDEALHRTSRP